ncbi:MULTISPECIES: cupin domain-containing protein [Marinomonas]|uniref:cupin domain-containing protein n=1 Tax=Marinomonas TaxID=28253 RepID=UPI001055926A|nr:cupin domain-containing protein [Marinomonas flavescens]
MIKIEKPTPLQLEKAQSWEIWEKEPISYSHYYDKNESFYFLQGVAEIELKGGDTYTVKAGDFVTIDAGDQTNWVIKETVRKHFLFF